MKNVNVLIVEDETIVAANITKILELSGYTVLEFAITGNEAIEKVEKLHPDIIIMDINIIGDMDGIETSSEIRKKYDIPIVFLTGYSDKETVDRVKKETPYGYVLKPFRKRELEVVIEMAVYKHQTELELRKKDERYKRLVNNAPLGVFSITVNGYIMEINPIFSQIIGGQIDTDESAINIFLNQSFITCGYVDDVKKCIDSAEIIKSDYTFTNSDGKDFVLYCHISPILDESGNITGVLTIAEDITDRTEIERELSNSEEWLAMALQSSGMGFFDWDLQTDYTIYDYNWVTILEYNYEDVNADISFWQNNIHPDDRENVLDQLKQHIEGMTEVFSCQHRLKAKSGEWKLVAVYAAVIQRDLSGTPIRMIGTIKDITEIINTQVELKKKQSKFDSLFDMLPHPAILWEIVDDEFFLIRYNKAAIDESIGEISNFKGIESRNFYEKSKIVVDNMHTCYKTKESLYKKVKYYNMFKARETESLLSFIFIPDQYVLIYAEDSK